MKQMNSKNRPALNAISLAICALATTHVAYAQQTEKELSTVVVTGVRASLESALNAKRNDNGIVDVIKAEDMGKFPDTNLAESLQRIPGVVIDRYGDVVVLQLSSAGAMRWRDAIVDAVAATLQPKTIFERSDADVLALEGLQPHIGLLSGVAPAPEMTVSDAGLRFEIDVPHGHKTGFYIDQRDNRSHLRALAAGCEVLDCFAYSGGFTVNALKGGAQSVTAVDSAGPALEILRRNAARNQLPVPECIEGDVFQVLRKMRDQARRFDLIVLDPPKFAPTAAHAEKAARAYKDINLLGFKLLRPGGLLFTFSCSGGVSRDLFQKVVAGAALDAGVDAQIVHHLSAGADHPVALNFPESEYLKGVVCRVGG